MPHYEGGGLLEKQVTKLAPKPKMEKKKKVAAYARVSSGKDAMLHSLAQQISYYSDLIQREPEWSFAGVYADEAFTGTKESRPEFQRLLADCRNGNVDIILTKSISRFARNTVTLLETVRELKGLGIDIYFEEQRIHTMRADGELMLTILASYAQEESKSASDNQKWRIRKGFEEGELMCLRTMFGYRISKKHGIEVDPEQAKIVREIFSRAIRGDSLNSITRWLNRSGIYGVFGGKWTTPKLREFISNEKYTGNALLQKVFINNHLEKKKVKNQGELPQYYVTETHPAIIDQATFDAAQEALKRILHVHPSGKQKHHYPFTGMILCPACGLHYKHVTNHGLPRWACTTFIQEGKAYCQSKKIPEDELIRITCDVLGWSSFDEEAFREAVDHITAVYPYELIFHLKDGTERKVEWQHQSRSKSWTPEMRARAAEYVKRRHHG